MPRKNSVSIQRLCVAERRLRFEQLEQRQLLAVDLTPSTTLVGLQSPGAMAVDSHGDLAVINSGNDTVSEFASEATSGTFTVLTVSGVAPTATTPTATLSGFQSPDALAFDSSGDLFVADFGSNTVSEFAPGATTPTATLVGIFAPDALAIDSNGDVFVGSAGGTIQEFAQGATTASASVLDTGGDVASLAFDHAENLYAGVAGTGIGETESFPGEFFTYGAYVVDEFAPGATQPTAVISDSDEPSALAFDASDDLYVTNRGYFYQVDENPSTFTPGTTVSEFGPARPLPPSRLPGSMDPARWPSTRWAICSWRAGARSKSSCPAFRRPSEHFWERTARHPCSSTPAATCSYPIPAMAR